MLWKYTILKFQRNRKADSRTFTSPITERVEYFTVSLTCVLKLLQAQASNSIRNKTY